MEVREWAESIKETIGRVIYGKSEVIEKLLVALLCKGHVLLEDVPGVGKTILARAISTTLGGDMQRIQCTPDLLPADVLGVSIYNQKTGEFTFRQGPIMTSILLVDEINRATPRTQSALLEAMEEARITVEGRTLDLPDPFFMLATENPVEFEGTFPLPEAQKDRFFLSTRMGYPTDEAEMEIMESQKRTTHPVTDLKPVTEIDTVRAMRAAVAQISVPDAVAEYILDIVSATRVDSRLKTGASPRASKALYSGAQALAAIRGRTEAGVDEVRELAGPVLWKRITVTSTNMLKGMNEERVIEEILQTVKVPEMVEATG